MSDYPLSTISSKKIKISAHSVFQKSACQTSMPNVVDKADYCHILRNQYVFIELYYQGKVMETAYNEWISFMGGTLYKRLNPKVTIFLTNTQNNELSNIMDRVKRTCPNCKVVNILWFEQCFQAKQKVSFDDYLLSTSKSKDSQKDKQQENSIELLKIQGFLKNICEDIEVEYLQFFKNRKNSAFQVAAKNHNYQQFELLRGRDIDLGPNPNKKKNVKPEANQNTANKKKRLNRNTIKQITNKETRNESMQPRATQESDETKSMDKKELQKNKQCREQQQKAVQMQKGISSNFIFQKQKIFNLNEMMDKYLQRTENSKSSGRRETSIINLNSNDVVVNSKSSESQLISQVNFEGKNNKGIKQSKLSLRLSKDTVTIPTHLSHTPRYKEAIKRKQVTDVELYAQIELLKIDLAKQVPNRLIVVTDSKTLQSKIQFSNRLASNNDFILFKMINYKTYWALLNELHPFHRAYFLLNPHRVIDRPLYFALKTLSSVHPKLISSKIVDEAIDYNTKLKNGKIMPKKIQFERFQGLKELGLPLRDQVIRNRSITFLQTELSIQVLQQIVKKLGGEWVRHQDYITRVQVDIVVTNRHTILDTRKKCEYFCQHQLWKKIFPLPDDQNNYHQ